MRPQILPGHGYTTDVHLHKTHKSSHVSWYILRTLLIHTAKIIMHYYPLFRQTETQEWIRVLTAHVSCMHHIYSNKMQAN